MDIKTKSVFIGADKDKSYNSVVTPIYPSSTFRFDALGKHRGFDYTRSGNPTREALEDNLASLEGGIGATATATGMAAITALLFLWRPGDHIIAGNDIYGGTYRLFKDVFTRMSFSFSFVNMMDLEQVKREIRPQTKLIWIETPSNPLLHIIDLKETITLAKERGILSVVDNTFLTPYFQKPFEHGADLIVHSTTKYLNGHSDVVGGVIVYNEKEIGEKIRFLTNSLGVTESPFDSWLVLRGIKTLAYRMEGHQENAMKIATFLEGHSHVKKVYYPGLKSHPQQELIRKQMKGHGGMLTFELDTERVSVESFFSKKKIFQLAESLGAVESLIEQPYTMSHASMGEAGLKEAGITEEMVRVSVGLESTEDLIAELQEALK